MKSVPSPERTLVLHPAARVLWRANDAVQLELGSRAVVVDGVTGPLVGRLARTGHRSTPADSESLGLALAALRAGGFVWIRTDDGADPTANLAPTAAQGVPVARLSADLAALRVRHGARGDDVLTARREAAVAVHGTGRLAAGVATLLAAAGVGRIWLRDSGLVRRHDAAPGGLLESDEGRRFAEAAAEAIHRAAPEADTGPLPPGQRPDLVIIAQDEPLDPDVRDSLHSRNCAYLMTRAAAEHAVVGPLVLPGLTSCVGCADLHRLDRDAAWSALAVQLSTPSRYGAPSDVSLTSFASSVCALQALAYLDGDDPATLDGTLELHLPDWRTRRRSWATHPGCDCGAHATTS